MIDSATISAARAVPIERIVDERRIKLRGRVERVGPCPVCGGTDRFSINTKKRVFNCRGCGGTGDVIALTMFLDDISFLEACAVLVGERPASSTHNKPPHEPEHERQREQRECDLEEHERRQWEKARYLWCASKAATGTLVETYLRTRGIAPLLPSTVRFLPPLQPGQHPAMVVPYGLPDEPKPGVLDIAEKAITAVQLTLLRPDGRGKADVQPNKITIASPADMPMVLAPMNDLLGLAICEGVEDALSVRRATGLGAWASGGATFMPKLADAVPGYVEALTIFAHADEAGQRGAIQLAEILVARGIEVLIESATP